MKAKLLILLSGLMFMVISVQAQTKQGTFLAGGSLTLDFQKNKAEQGNTTVDLGNTNSVVINPTFGYFFMDGLSAGIQLGINSTKFKSNLNNQETTFTDWTVGPFVKYYHETNLFGMASVGFGTSKQKTNNNENKDGIFQWRLGVGYAFFLNEHVAIEPMMSYGATNYKDNDTDPDSKSINNSFRLSGGIIIFI